MSWGKKLKKALNKVNKSGLGGIAGLTMRAIGADYGARDMVRREEKNQAIERQRQLTEAERQAKAAEEARIFAENEANKAIKAEEDRKRTLFGGEIDQQLREKKELLGNAEDPEEKARKEFLRRKLLGT